MSQYVITNGRIYTEAQVIEKGYLVVENGKISDIQKGDYKGHLNQIDVAGKHVLPGFIDIHIHGGYGEDAMDASYDGLNHLAKQLLSEGTTTFLATTMTQSDENIEKALNNIVACYENQTLGEAAEIGGVHLEGPFISEHKVGAQNPKYVQRPTVEKIRHFQEVAKGLIKIITFAPEVEGAHETLNELRDDIIFSMGHTVATFEEANEATHMYLITDAMRAKGMKDGEYDLGGQNVIVKGKEARLENGTLAGSILKMNEGLHNLIQFTHDSLDHLWRVASLNQAIALNIDKQKGSLSIGKDADIVIVDDHIQVDTTIKSGTIHHF